jgi:hypothetical protein
MKLGILLTIMLAFAATESRAASDITFGRSATAVVTRAKKRNFRQDIVAVNQAHESWKKAHLNASLYACQRNAERVAVLARKVSDRIEATKKSAVTAAKAVEKTMAAAVGADATEIPEELDADQLDALRAKAKQLGKARKQADLLERLAGQVEHFYRYDIPKESAVDGNCVAQYRVAVVKGLNASVRYHEDADQLAKKLEKAATAAKVAWKKAERALSVAAR